MNGLRPFIEQSSYRILSENERNDFSRDLYQLYQSVTIDRPNYLIRGFRHPWITEYERRDSSHDHVDNWRHNYSIRGDFGSIEEGRVTTRNIIVHDVQEILMSLLKSRHVYVTNLLPHYDTQDVELRLDANLQPLPKEKWESKNGLSKTPFAETQHRIAVVIHGPTSYFMYYNGGVRDRRLLGLHAMKARHLTTLGYRVVQIPFVELKECRDKVLYMRHKLWDAIDDVDR